MVKRRWWIGGAVVALALAGYLAARLWVLPIRVDAPEPTPSADVVDALPVIPRSILITPIAFDLDPAAAQFEADMPRVFGSLDKRMRAEGATGVEVAFAARRSPFRMHVEGAEVVIETEVEYEGRGWYDPPVGPAVSAGCGDGDGPPPRLRLRIVSSPSLTPDWGLRTRTQVDVARFSREPHDECQVTLLKFDVTRKVVSAVRAEMAEVLAEFDRDVAQFDLRGEIADLWSTVETPIRLTDGVWLVIQPDTVQLVSLGGAGNTLTAVVRLTAWPKVVTGACPADSAYRTPLPSLGSAAAADTSAELHVALQGILAYDVAAGLLRKPLVGKVIRVAGRRVRIEAVELRGIGTGRVALGVTVSGAVAGRIFFTGTPQLDLETQQLTFPDLDFDIGSADLLARSLSWWRGDAVRDFLRAKAAIPDSVCLASLERLAERAMNRDLTAGVHLQTTLASSHGMSVNATREHLTVRALATGESRIAVDRVLARVGGRRPARRRP